MPIAVLGTPRSGSSATANILSALGVNMGVSIPANGWNPSGFFTDAELNAWHMLLVPYRLRDGIDSSAITLQLQYLSAYQAVLANRVAAGEPWGVKDSFLPYVFSLLAKACPSVKIVNVTRDLQTSADSWFSCCNNPALSGPFSVTADQALNTITLANTCIQGVIAGVDPSTVLTFDFSTLTAPATMAAVVDSIAQFVGLPVTPAALNVVNSTPVNF
jgi:hypothetical protein